MGFQFVTGRSLSRGISIVEPLSDSSAQGHATYLAPFKMPRWANPSRNGSSSQTMSEMASAMLNVPRMVRTMARIFLVRDKHRLGYSKPGKKHKHRRGAKGNQISRQFKFKDKKGYLGGQQHIHWGLVLLVSNHGSQRLFLFPLSGRKWW